MLDLVHRDLRVDHERDIAFHRGIARRCPIDRRAVGRDVVRAHKPDIDGAADVPRCAEAWIERADRCDVFAVDDDRRRLPQMEARRARRHRIGVAPHDRAHQRHGLALERCEAGVAPRWFVDRRYDEEPRGHRDLEWIATGVRLEDVPEFEEAQRGGVLVLCGEREHARNEREAQVALVFGERVHDLDRLRRERHARGHEALVDRARLQREGQHLAVAARRERVRDRTLVEVVGARDGLLVDGRRCRFDAIVPDDAGDFFGDVRIDRNVAAPIRRHDAQRDVEFVADLRAVAVALDLEPQCAQRAVDLERRNVDADQRADALLGEFDRVRRICRRADGKRRLCGRAVGDQ